MSTAGVFKVYLLWRLLSKSSAFEKEKCRISLNRRPKQSKDYLKFSQLSVDVLLVCTDNSGIIAGFKQEASTYSGLSPLPAVNLTCSLGQQMSQPCPHLSSIWSSIHHSYVLTDALICQPATSLTHSILCPLA